MTEHDFNDGKGAVPAHQHPNGSGWVANTATVASSAYVGLEATVFDTARVYSGVRLLGTTRLFGNARLYGGARVDDGGVLQVLAHLKAELDEARAANEAVVVGILATGHIALPPVLEQPEFWTLIKGEAYAKAVLNRAALEPKESE